PLLPRARLARARPADGFTNGVGRISLRRGRRGDERIRAASGGGAVRLATGGRRLARGALHRNGVSHRLHDPVSPLPSALPADRTRTTEREAVLTASHATGSPLAGSTNPGGEERR